MLHDLSKGAVRVRHDNAVDPRDRHIGTDQDCAGLTLPRNRHVATVGEEAKITGTRGIERLNRPYSPGTVALDRSADQVSDLTQCERAAHGLLGRVEAGHELGCDVIDLAHVHHGARLNDEIVALLFTDCLHDGAHALEQ